MTDNMFEKASRLKLRFDTPQGRLSLDDLWDLPLASGPANIDALAIDLHGKIEGGSVSFVSEIKKDDINELRFEIVKHVIGVRLDERKSAEEAQDRHARKQHVLSIIARKEDEELAGKSLDELRDLIGDL